MSELDAETDGSEDPYPEVLSDAEVVLEDIDELEDDPNAARMSSSSEGRCSPRQVYWLLTIYLEEPQDVTFLVPKLNSLASKPLVLPSNTSWTKFSRSVALIMGEDRHTLSVSYRLSTSPATAPFATLDSPDEYYDMIKKYLKVLDTSSKGKNGQLDIKIKSQVEPVKVPVSTRVTEDIHVV